MTSHQSILESGSTEPNRFRSARLPAAVIQESVANKATQLVRSLALAVVVMTALRCAAQNTYPFPSSGDVGIGTTSPTNLLTVSGTGMNPLIGSIVTDVTTSSVAGFAATADTTRLSLLAHGSIRTTNRYDIALGGWDEIADLNEGSGASNGLAIGVQAASPIIFATQNTERMRIDGAGHVGIGTKDASNALCVAGTIEAYEVIVQTGWSDYVFSPGYHLTSLAEVASQIRKDGHLPGMPSAKDVAEHGVKIGEIQSLLLAKLEELTMHAIQQEQRLDEQANRINRLETENTQLRRIAKP